MGPSLQDWPAAVPKDNFRDRRPAPCPAATMQRSPQRAVDRAAQSKRISRHNQGWRVRRWRWRCDLPETPWPKRRAETRNACGRRLHPTRLGRSPASVFILRDGSMDVVIACAASSSVSPSAEKTRMASSTTAMTAVQYSNIAGRIQNPSKRSRSNTLPTS